MLQPTYSKINCSAAAVAAAVENHFNENDKADLQYEELCKLVPQYSPLLVAQTVPQLIRCGKKWSTDAEVDGDENNWEVVETLRDWEMPAQPAD